jgi:hypothetical protein
MTVSVADRVWETTTTTGTGSISMGGAKTGFQAFSAGFSSGNTIYYCIAGQGTSEWEVGQGTLTSGTPWTMSRDTVIASSNSGSKTSFSSGTKDIFCDGAPSSIVALIYTAVQTSRNVSTGDGLTGGGDLSADRTHKINAAPSTISSATTTDLSSVTTINVVISGTTTITSFGNGTNLFRVGTFSGALTLTYNASSLILPGAASITTVAGDSFVAVSDGSHNWTVLVYMRASGIPVGFNFGTSQAVTLGTIELGNASDTTVSRSAAGVLAVEGINALLAGKTDTISKGFTLTPNSLGNIGSSYTPDPTAGNYQYGTNHVASTWSAPSSDCAIDILVTNDSTAGAITFSGYTVSAATGDALDTTNTHKFIISIRRINSVATYVIKALQ